MAEIVDLATVRGRATPYMSGAAACMACHHSWVAVAPVGTYELECPECHSTKGYYVNTVVRGEEVFECFCGCDMFRISRVHGPYCVNCATPAKG
jgi:hypothetical protein